MMDALRRDVRHTLRSLRQSPGFALVAVLALALGIGANSAVFSVVNGVLLTPPPFSEPERVVHLQGNIAQAGLEDISLSVPEYVDLATRSRAFESVAAYRGGNLTLTGREIPQQLAAVVATPSFFTTLGVSPVLGRAFTEAEAVQGRERVVVLTDTAWRVHFARDAQVLGQTMQLDGEPYTVVGVLPAGVAYPAWAEMYVPFVPTEAQRQEDQRGARFLSVVGRLKPGVTQDAARTDLARVALEMEEAVPSRYRKVGWSFSVTSLDEKVVGNVRGTLWLLLGAVGFVLLAACSSVANLLLARMAARGREVSIRAALGASRGRLVAQFLTESLVLSLAGGVLGMLLALWGTDALVALVGEALPRASQVRLDARPLVFTLSVSLLTGVLFGLGPALHGSREDLSVAMREGSRSTEGHGSGRMRAGLVVGQVAVALVLLVGAGLFTKSFLALRAVDAGFTPEGVLTGKLVLPSARYPDAASKVAFQRELLGRLQSLPGVESVGVTNLLPLGGRSDSSFDIEGRPQAPGEVWPAVEFRAVSPGYLRTLRVTPRQGHLLEGDGTEGPDAPWQVVINKTFADLYWPQGDALGQRLKLHWDTAQWTTVVGIVDDVREWGLDTPARPAAYYPAAKVPTPFLALAVRAKSGGSPEALRTAIEAELRAVDGNLALYAVAPLTRLVDESISSRQVSALLMGLFAGTALLLAALGISGVIGYSVAQRTREMGIRMALGASRTRVLTLVLGQGLRLTALGVVLGLGLSLGLARLLDAMLYGVAAYDGWTFAGVALLLGTVAVLAAWLPARRATRVDPAIALRAE